MSAPGPLDEHETARVARLAQLRLEPEELAALAADLRRIVAYLDALEQAGEAGHAAIPWAPFETDVHREDRAIGGLDRSEALRNAAGHDGACFVVPRDRGREPA